MELRRLALVIEYNGSESVGFQRQTRRPAAPAESLADKPSLRRLCLAQKKYLQLSVQEELENKLSLILDEPICLDAAGRTDAGVHATGQVVAFNTSKDWTTDKLLRSINSIVAPWIRVLSAHRVSADFRPRFQTRCRLYHYYFLPGQGRDQDPFWEKLAWVLPYSLNFEAMQAAADMLVGEHDFRAYSRGEPLSKNTRRTIRRLTFRPSGDCFPGLESGPFARLTQLWCLEVEADAFLQRMVRQIAANLVQVGKGEWEVERPYSILLSRDPRQGVHPAPPQGVCLARVSYAELEGSH